MIGRSEVSVKTHRVWLWNQPTTGAKYAIGKGAAPQCGLSRPARPPSVPADPKTMPELGGGSRLDDFA